MVEGKQEAAAPSGAEPRAVQRVSLLNKLVAICDRYGHTSLNDPRRQPQSLPGMLVTSLFSGTTVLLLALTILKVTNSNKEIRLGGRAPLNGLYQTRVGGNSSDTSVQTWDDFYIPSLELKLGAKLIFFQRQTDRRPIFKVEVRDRNGYHQTLTSDTEPSPVASAARSTHEVPINTFDERVNTAVVPPTKNIKFNLQDKLYFANVVKSFESLQVVKALSTASARVFRDHEATLYVRFQKEQLKRLKKCQLQIILYNEGQFKELADRGVLLNETYLQQRVLTGQSSNAVTWLPSSFNKGKLDKDMNLVITSANMTGGQLASFFDVLGGERHTRGMMDWSYTINYVNNFNHTYTADACDGVADFRPVVVTRVPTMRLSEDELVLDRSAAVVWPFTPFQLLVQGWGRRERMLVTHVAESSNASEGNRWIMRVTRSAPPGERVPRDPQALAKHPLAPGGPNATWHCPLRMFGDGVCNCECGGLDSDCAASPAAMTGCEALTAYGSLCNLDGRCVAEMDTTLSISEGCPGTSGLRMRGETALVGLQGAAVEALEKLQNNKPRQEREGEAPGAVADVAEGCVPCPGDAVFEGVARPGGPDGELTCMPPAVAWIAADVNSQDVLRRGWGTTYAAPGGEAGDEMVTVVASMAPGLAIPDPRLNPMAPPLGFEARVSIGTRLVEPVRLVGVEDLGFGMAAVTLRRGNKTRAGEAAREGTVTFRNQSLLFGEGDYCAYGLVGELVSTIDTDTRKIEVLLPNNVRDTHPELISIGYYFPAVSPHEAAHAKSAFQLRINGRSLHAAEVSR